MDKILPWPDNDGSGATPKNKLENSGDIGQWRIEGHWRESEDEKDSLPWPVATPGWGEAEFLIKLRQVEAKAMWNEYRGWSTSRLTGEHNGSREYLYKGWRWPEGLGHYIERGVKPSDDFVAFIKAESVG